MDPVEINAGSWYLRQLRADDQLDDRPALVAAFADAELRRWVTRWRIEDLADATGYVARRSDEWAHNERCSWAIAQPSTGELVGEVDLISLDAEFETAEAGCWVAPAWRGQGVAPSALGAVLRFSVVELPLQRIDYLHAPGNTASRRVAEKLGFTRIGERDGLLLHRLIFP